MLNYEMTMAEVDPTVAQAIEAIQILIGKYCNAKPVFEQALDAWWDETNQEDVMELAFKEHKTQADLSKVKFNRVALDFMIIESLTQLTNTMQKFEKELVKINLVIDYLCKDAKITRA